MKNLYKQFKTGLIKTRSAFLGKLRDTLSKSSELDDELIEKIEQNLIESDIGVKTAYYLIDDLTARYRKEKKPTFPEFQALLKEKLLEYLGENTPGAAQEEITDKPHVILMVGVNGTGKTTTIGKLAYRYKQEGKTVLFAAADTFRAAAVEQLDIWRERVGADIVKTKQGADPAAVAYDSLQAAMSRSIDVLIIDTAGRIHTKTNLMEELRKIKRTLQKLKSSSPHETLLVLDANTGQNSLNQAREFNNTIGVDGIVLTKLDGTAKGGIIIPILKELKIPVKYIGLGEKITDLEVFDHETFIDALVFD